MDRAKREVAVFYGVTVPVTWIVWLPALSDEALGVFVTIGTFVPSAVGLALSYRFGGSAGCRSLCRSLLDLRIGFRWLPFIFLLLPGVSAVAALLVFLSGGTLPPPAFPPLAIPLAFAYILILMGPLGEEAGWRGFALKRLLECTTPLKAALLVGCGWAVWHLPLFFAVGTTQQRLTSLGLVSVLLGYLAYTLMISVLMTVLYVGSNGSVFASILLHTVANLSLGVVPILFSRDGAFSIILVLAIVTVVVAWLFRDTLSGQRGEHLR